MKNWPPIERRRHWIWSRRRALAWCKKHRDHPNYDVFRGLLDNIYEWEGYLGGVILADRSMPYRYGERRQDGVKPPGEDSSWFTPAQLAGMALAGPGCSERRGILGQLASKFLLWRAKERCNDATFETTWFSRLFRRGNR